MRGFRLASLLLLVALAGCARGGGANGGKTRSVANKTRPVLIVLSQKKNSDDCVPIVGNVKHQAFNGDTIAWEFVNNCETDQDVEVILKTATNPFISSAPWVKTIKKNTDDSITLVINDDTTAVPAGIYKFDVRAGTKTVDPRLEIDP